MRGSIKIANIFGISVNIHLTFFLLPLIFGVLAGLKGIFLILFVFSCVTIHELMHSLAAMYFGIKVKSITLYPIGGIAAIDKMPDRPRDELVISLAGPASNFVIATVLYIILKNILPYNSLYNILGRIDTWQNTLGATIWINVMLGLFNLLPAFPMDGGRVFRALLAQTMNYRKATHIAVITSNVFAAIFIILSLWKGYIMLGLIAVFLYIASNQEQTQVDIKMTLKDHRVVDILDKQLLTVSPQTSVTDMLALIFHSHQEDFPVVSENRIEGFVPRIKIMTALHSGHTTKTAAELMLKQFPQVHPQDNLIDVYKIMQGSGFKALPVVSEGSPVGLITLEDIGRIYAIMSGKM